MKLVPDWRDGAKWVSVHALWIAGALPGVWEHLPMRWQEVVPFNVICVCAAITAGCGLIGRFTDQNIKSKDDRPC